MALDLVLLGVVLVLLSLLSRRLDGEFPGLTFVTELVGGTLCVLWGVLGRRGTRCRSGAMVTLAVVACALVWRAVQSWPTSAGGGLKGRTGIALLAVLVVFCVGMLINLAQEEEGG